MKIRNTEISDDQIIDVWIDLKGDAGRSSIKVKTSSCDYTFANTTDEEMRNVQFFNAAKHNQQKNKIYADLPYRIDRYLKLKTIGIETCSDSAESLLEESVEEIPKLREKIQAQEKQIAAHEKALDKILSFDGMLESPLRGLVHKDHKYVGDLEYALSVIIDCCRNVNESN